MEEEPQSQKQKDDGNEWYWIQVSLTCHALLQSVVVWTAVGLVLKLQSRTVSALLIVTPGFLLLLFVVVSFGWFVLFDRQEQQQEQGRFESQQGAKQ